VRFDEIQIELRAELPSGTRVPSEVRIADITIWMTSRPRIRHESPKGGGAAYRDAP
jgi:hypothetical protein